MSNVSACSRSCCGIFVLLACILLAARGAREGLSVLLVNRTQHLGGMLSSGLRVWDTLYEGRGSPIYVEVRSAIYRHYRVTYGEDSPQYIAALPAPGGARKRPVRAVRGRKDSHRVMMWKKLDRK